MSDCSRQAFKKKARMVYVIVAYDLLEYCPTSYVVAIYASREAAERNLPKDYEYSAYTIEEYPLQT